MFEQDVAGLIKALRANKNDEQGVIDQAIEECRQEIRSSDVEMKAAAVLKLVYLEMLGQPIGFASFAIIECMSSIKFHIKAIGYLAASQSFTQDTEVALLVVNLVKKDLSTPPTSTFTGSATALSVAHLQMVLSALATLLTPTLARDLAGDLLGLLSHSRPVIRRQAILLLWKMARSWPGVFEVAFPRSDEDPWIGRLRERLEDEDMTVVGATVNLVCELARKDPKTYLPLAPELFGLLTGGTNNWMLIKIVKLFAVLTPHEPRLVKKLVPPLTELIDTTPAMSLLYECIQTSIIGGILNGPDGERLASVCVEKLHGFLEDVDQNLRYIALLAIHKILPTHPHLVAHEYETVMTCLDDPDLAIRSKALSIVEGMITRDNLEPTVEKLMSQLNSPIARSASQSLASVKPAAGAATAAAVTASFAPSYKRSVVSSIVRICSADTYAAVTDFEWYIDALVSLAYVTRSLSSTATSATEERVGSTIKNALIDVSARVKAIRPHAVSKCEELIRDESFIDTSAGSTPTPADDACTVAGGAAWVVGEYCSELADPRPTIASFFAASTLPDGVTTSFLHNGTKVYARWLAGLAGEWDPVDGARQVRDVTNALKRRCEECAGRIDRASELAHLFGLILSLLDAVPTESGPQASQSTEGQDGEYDNPFGASSSPRSRFGTAPSALSLMRPLFDAFPLNPVNAKAQSMVAVPPGLDLDQVLYDVPLPSLLDGSDSMVGEEVDEYGRPVRTGGAFADTSRKDKVKKGDKLKKTKKGGKKSRKGTATAGDDGEDLIDVDSIPIVQLSLDGVSPESAPATESETLKRPKKKKAVPVMEVDIDGELPEGALTPAAPPTRTATPDPSNVANVANVAAGTEEMHDSQEIAPKVVVVKKKRKDGTRKSTKTGAVKE